MEFLALFLIAPLIWIGAEGSSSSVPSESIEVAATGFVRTTPRIETDDGRWSISPPLDTSLTMTVIEHQSGMKSRGPASAGTNSRRIDVIVSAP